MKRMETPVEEMDLGCNLTVFLWIQNKHCYRKYIFNGKITFAVVPILKTCNVEEHENCTVTHVMTFLESADNLSL